MKVKEKNEKAGLKLNIQKTKIMSSSPITSWQTDGETMETVTDFLRQEKSNKNKFQTNLRYTDDTTLMAESEEKLKSLLMKVKGE